MRVPTEDKMFNIDFIFCQARQQIYSLQPPAARLPLCLLIPVVQEEWEPGGLMHKKASCANFVSCLHV